LLGSGGRSLRLGGGGNGWPGSWLGNGGIGGSGGSPFVAAASATGAGGIESKGGGGGSGDVLSVGGSAAGGGFITSGVGGSGGGDGGACGGSFCAPSGIAPVDCSGWPAGLNGCADKASVTA
jgi:hypothetical protein